jgi:hypothetical protein
MIPVIILTSWIINLPFVIHLVNTDEVATGAVRHVRRHRACRTRMRPARSALDSRTIPRMTRP